MIQYDEDIQQGENGIGFKAIYVKQFQVVSLI